MTKTAFPDLDLDLRFTQRQVYAHGLELLWGWNKIQVLLSVGRFTSVALHLLDVEGEGSVLYSHGPDGANRIPVTTDQPLVLEGRWSNAALLRVLVQPVSAQVALQTTYQLVPDPLVKVYPRVTVTERMPTE